MKKNLVVQSNKLIEAHYKQEYTVQEQRMVLWVISEIHKEDYFYTENYERKKITISAKKYAEIIGVSEKNIYRDAAKVGEELMQKVIKITNDDGWKMFHWVSSMQYKKGAGEIEVTISPDIIPYIIDLKEKFTSFRLENILYLSSSHAIKLYQLLAQYRDIKERTIKVDELRSLLGISELKTYQLYSALKRKILEVSKREINNKTDLTIDYREIKKSRKVVAIEFIIKSKPTQEQQAKRLFEAWLSTLDESDALPHMFKHNGYKNDFVQEQFAEWVKGRIVNYRKKSTAKLQLKESEQ